MCRSRTAKRSRPTRRRNTARPYPTHVSGRSVRRTTRRELQQLKESQMCEQQKAEAKTARLQKELDQLKAEKQTNAWRSQVAEETSPPANLITGSTLEAMQRRTRRPSTNTRHPACHTTHRIKDIQRLDMLRLRLSGVQGAPAELSRLVGCGYHHQGQDHRQIGATRHHLTHRSRRYGPVYLVWDVWQAHTRFAGYDKARRRHRSTASVAD